MGLQGKQTKAWFDRAKQVLVGGVSSGFRWGGEDATFVVERGEGAYVYDMDGNRYIDYVMGFGPVMLGHAHPAVVKAVSQAASEGVSFAMTQRREVEAAEWFKRAVPWIDGMRFTNTGTEATMHAIRLARAHTGREVIAKFEGAYHGAHDGVLYSTAGAPVASLGPRQDPIPHPLSPGIPAMTASLIRTLPFNDLEPVERLFRSEPIAALMVEPMLGNAFAIMPSPGFLEGLRTLCTEYGVVLIFDEVKTGFRIALGGAQEYFGVTPDLATYAKSLGNGFPVAAIAGRKELVSRWQEGVFQSGTYSGNGVAVAAAAATLEVMVSNEPFLHVKRIGTALMEGFGKILAEQGLAATVSGHPALFGVFLGEGTPTEYRDAVRHDGPLFLDISRGLIPRGVMPVEDAQEPFFVSAAHSDEDVAVTLSAFQQSVQDALNTRSHRG